MEVTIKALKKPLWIVSFLFIWSSVLTEYIVYLTHSEDFFLYSILHISLYFTILSNLLIGMSISGILFSKKLPFLKLFSSPKFSTANLSYITIVAIVYNVLIRNTWDPQGIEIVIQEFLHVVNPLLFLLCWLLFIDTRELKYFDTISFLLFPLIYLILTFVRGTFTGFYPYWFLDVGKIGWITVSAYSFGLFLIFLFFGLLYIFIGRKKTLIS